MRGQNLFKPLQSVAPSKVDAGSAGAHGRPGAVFCYHFKIGSWWIAGIVQLDQGSAFIVHVTASGDDL